MRALNPPLLELNQSGISLPDRYHYVKDCERMVIARDGCETG